ncbi:MAG: hypothetical protein LBP76_11830 [Treponema sp.]|nr:hypothetical protein [Treponema sp.]
MAASVTIYREEAKRIIKETLILFEQRLKYWDDIKNGKYQGWQLTDQTERLVRHYSALHRINSNHVLDNNSSWDTMYDANLSHMLCKCIVLADLYELEVNGLPNLAGLQGAASPFEILNENPSGFNFGYILPVDQVRYLREQFEEANASDLQNKGKKATELRNLVKEMKIDALFALEPNFMNKDLRNFLNLKEDGTENYTWEEIRYNLDWEEYPSAGAKFHQTTASDEYMYIKMGRGNEFRIYTRLHAKFCNKKDGREVVFRYNAESDSGEMVTEDIDRGTYNYSGRGKIASGAETVFYGGHSRFDVVPFEKEYLSKVVCKENEYMGLFWGNSKYWRWQE